MPLVFVHGVNTRRSTTPQEQQIFDQRIGLRDGLLRNIAFVDLVKPGAALTIENPYWGDLAAKFAWNLGSIPRGGDEALGSVPNPDTEQGRLAHIVVETTTERAAAATTNPKAVLLTLARQATLGHAVDALIAATANASVPRVAPDASRASALAAFAARALVYAEAKPKPPWLQAVTSDLDFVAQLHREVEATAPPVQVPPGGRDEVLGGPGDILNWLKTGAIKFEQAATGVLRGLARGVSRPAIHALRPAKTLQLGYLFGDVCVYLQTRGDKNAPGPIVRRVIAALDRAITAKSAADPDLYIVAHSMGGNIVYDILTYYRPDVECAALVTVGAQVALFEEMKLFRTSDKTVPSAAQNKVPRPANIGRWINVYDDLDVLGFTTKAVFEGTRNFSFDNDTLPIASHGTYFEYPRFHERLRARLTER